MLTNSKRQINKVHNKIYLDLYVWQKPNNQLKSFKIRVAANNKYNIYDKYPYFSGRPYVTKTSKPNPKYINSYSDKKNGGLEWGERSARTILFSDKSGLTPVNASTLSKKNSKHLEKLKGSGFFDHVSVWRDRQGQWYFLLEPYTSDPGWEHIFNSLGFNAIEVPDLIAPYRGGKKPNQTKSFLVTPIQDPIDLQGLDLMLIALTLSSVTQSEYDSLVRIEGAL